LNGQKKLEFLKDGDDINEAMYKHLVHMCQEFSNERHSGVSASYAANILNRLFRRLPVRPLTGEDNEWEQVSEGVWQNKRCSRVFKEVNGRAYDVNGRVFRKPNGVCYTNSNSRVFITFPYMPKTEYVDVEAS